MWHSIHSTGVAAFDKAHEDIDALLDGLTASSTPQEEHHCLMQVYCAIIEHIRFKNEFLGANLSRQEKAHDADYLRQVRQKIKERERGNITRKELISTLRHLLMVHAAQHQHAEDPPGSPP